MLALGFLRLRNGLRANSGPKSAQGHVIRENLVARPRRLPQDIKIGRKASQDELFSGTGSHKLQAVLGGPSQVPCPRGPRILCTPPVVPLPVLPVYRQKSLSGHSKQELPTSNTRRRREASIATAVLQRRDTCFAAPLAAAADWATSSPNALSTEHHRGRGRDGKFFDICSVPGGAGV